MTTVHPWTDEVHGKARLLHDQIAALSSKAAEANDGGALAGILCAPYYAMLDRLYADELPWARAMDDSDLVVRLRGPAMDDAAPRVKLIADAFDAVRGQVQAIARAISGVARGKSIPDDLDLGLSGFARGSVMMGLKVRDRADAPQATLLGDDDPLLQATREAVRQLGEVTRFISDAGVAQDFARRIEDPAVRDAILVAATKLAPTGRNGIDAVELTTPGMAAGVAMTPLTRAMLRQAIMHPVRQAERARFTGTVRELDLDLMRFELRRMPDWPSLRCVYVDIPEDRARELLNATVEAGGHVEFNSAGLPRLLQVEEYRIVQAAPDQPRLPLD